jgi:hypothetical protein
MTDARSPQLGAAAITIGEPNSQVPQFAIVAVCSEVPPLAGGARAQQFAIVTVSKEFTIPPIYTPMGLGQFMATMPYYIGAFPDGE